MRPAVAFGPASKRAVIVMAKRPKPGVTKTRLRPALTMAQAAAAYECFLLDTIERLCRRNDCTVVIAVDQPESAPYFSSIAPGLAQVAQVGETLGERLDAVLTTCLGQGFGQVFAIGSDSPDLPAGHLNDAFTALGGETDVVVGPSDDGGYYLIGQKRRWSELVVDVTMSTPRVLHDTLAVAEKIGATVALAPEWYDVDSPGDLDRLRANLGPDSDSHSARFFATI